VTKIYSKELLNKIYPASSNLRKKMRPNKLLQCLKSLKMNLGASTSNFCLIIVTTYWIILQFKLIWISEQKGTSYQIIKV